MERARSTLTDVVSGKRDPYDGYREVYSIYLGNSGAAKVLKPLFCLPGSYPDGAIHVNETFRRTIVSAASAWLQSNPA